MYKLIIRGNNMKTSRIAAIDVGTTKICTVMADTGGVGGLRIVGVGITPSQGMHKGLVVNINEAKQSIRESVRKAEQVAGHKIESALIGITGRQISSLNNQGAIAITRGDQLVRPDDLKRVLNVARSVRVPTERKLLHVIPRTYKVDGQEGIDNPVGMHGFRLDVETHIITAMITSVQNLTKCIRGCGIEIDDLVLEPLASAEAVLDEEEKQDGVVLADIGGGTTDIALFREGTIYHTSVLPVAGYQITRDISVGLGLSYELAEEMKKKYGNVTPSIEEPDSDRTLTHDGHSISHNDLSEIIRVRVEELLRLIVLELPQADYRKLVPSGLVLTGGGANLPGIAELGQEITRLPVRIGTPMSLDGVSDSLCDPAYATAVGLLLWKAKNRDKQDLSIRESSLRRFVNSIFKIFR
jgi:cell division protein FtsA